jgi:hypothetical protein
VHGRKFEDVVLGEPDKSYQDILNAEVSRANRYLQQQDKTIREEAARLAAGEPTDIIAFAQMVAEQRNDNYRPTEKYLNKDDAKLPVQFEKYSEPGYKPGSSRELFVTAPRAEAPSIRKLQQEYSIAQRKLQSLFESKQYRTPEYASALEEVTRLNKELKEKGVNVPRGDAAFSDWQDGHTAYSNIQNPIVRIRFNEREVNGKRILFVEEFQGPNPENQAKMPESLRSRIYDIGVKRVVSYAKENGFDEIAWTNGKMQVDRYDLSKQIENLTYDFNTETQLGYLTAFSKLGKEPIIEEPISVDKLAGK